MLMQFEVLTPLRLVAGEDAVAIGEVVELSVKDGLSLVGLGAVRPVPEQANARDADRDDLAVLGVKALLELAKDEGVEVPPKVAKADLVAAIEAKRIADAAGADGAGDSQAKE